MFLWYGTGSPWSPRSTGCFFLEEQNLCITNNWNQRFSFSKFRSSHVPWERQGLSSIPSTMLTISLPIPVALWERTEAQRHGGVRGHFWSWSIWGCLFQWDRYLDTLSPASSSPSLWTALKLPWFSEPTPSWINTHTHLETSNDTHSWRHC